MKLKALVLAGLLSAGFQLSAQTWEVGGFAGGSGYMGDLNPVNPFYVKDPAFGLQLKRNFDAYWSLKLNAMHGKVRANDASSESAQYRQRNLSFFSPVTEVTLQAEFNFFSYVPSMSKKRYTPYLFAGFGGFFFNPKTTYKGNVYELNSFGTEGQNLSDPYKKYAVSIPYGIGMKYNITGKWSLVGELGYRTARTDFLDDVSGFYPAKSTLSNTTAIALSDRTGENTGVYLGATDTQRGDMRKKDTYMFTGISLTFTFISQKCPVVE